MSFTPTSQKLSVSLKCLSRKKPDVPCDPSSAEKFVDVRTLISRRFN